MMNLWINGRIKLGTTRCWTQISSQFMREHLSGSFGQKPHRLGRVAKQVEATMYFFERSDESVSLRNCFHS